MKITLADEKTNRVQTSNLLSVYKTKKALRYDAMSTIEGVLLLGDTLDKDVAKGWLMGALNELRAADGYIQKLFHTQRKDIPHECTCGHEFLNAEDILNHTGEQPL